MPHRYADQRSLSRRSARPYSFWCALLLTSCIGAVGSVHAEGAAASTQRKSSHAEAAEQLAIQVNNDRLTLQVAKAPQVYLYGVIDADAPQRFEALMKSGKISNGSDIYLNSSGGDLKAGLALGRLFRTGSMVTHLGTPKLGRHSTSVGKPAICAGACAYAYFGGLYRWAPTGADRLGLPSYQAMDPKDGSVSQSSLTPDEVVSYLKDMDIDPTAITSQLETSHDDIVWLSADQMIATRLANNGRLPLLATYQLQSGAPYLILHEVARNSERRITLLCEPGGTTLTATNTVGADQARQIVARGMRSYIEINRVETPPQQDGNADVVDQSVVIRRTYPSAQLGNLISAQSIGAWVSDRKSTLRFGFAFEVDGLKRILGNFYESCWRYAPWSTQQKTATSG